MPTAVDIERRTAIAVAGLLLCAPSLALAQKADRKLHIGILVGDTPSPGEEQALLEGLREQGFVEGRNLTVERGYADGRVQQVPGIARDFAALKLDAVIATCTPTTRAALQAFGASATSTPIIMAAVADPVGQRLITSLARPGANVTGRSSQAEDLIPKKLELFARVLGKPTTVAVLVDSNSAVHPRMFDALAPAARQLQLELVKVEAGRRPSDVQLPEAFATAMRQNAGAVFVLPDEPFFFARPRGDRGPGGQAPPAGLLRHPRIRRCRRVDELRREHDRDLPQPCGLHQQDRGRRETRRSAGRATDAVRAGDQHEDRQVAGHVDSPVGAGQREPADPVA